MDHMDKNIKALVDRYLKGECTEEEARMVNSYFNRIGKQMPDGGPVEDIDKRAQRVWKRIIGEPVVRRKLPPMFTLISAAAVVLIVIGLWFYSFYQDTKPSFVESALENSDIGPGSYGATLTFADGRSVSLDSTKRGVVVGESLQYEDGTSVSDEETSVLKEVNLLTATTVRGQTYSFTLPDGTKVWLNSDSRLTFPSEFADAERRVQLVGEGYFIVDHDDRHPFFVESRGQIVEDLGTAFNIEAYEEDVSVKTTLVEGAVKVNSTLLAPGQQSILLEAGEIKIVEADLQKVMAWQQGDFIFRGETLDEVLRIIARWYDIELVYVNEGVKKITVGGTVSRSRSIRAVLGLMEQTGKVKFEINGQVVTVL